MGLTSSKQVRFVEGPAKQEGRDDDWTNDLVENAIVCTVDASREV